MQMFVHYSSDRNFGNLDEASQIDLSVMSYGDRLVVKFDYVEAVATSEQTYPGQMKGGHIVVSRDSGLILAAALLRACVSEKAQNESQCISYVLKE